MDCLIHLSFLLICWSATASYRLMPEITITKPIPEELVEQFAKCFSDGVVSIGTDKSG